MGTKLSRPILNLLNEIHVIFGCGLIGVFVAISRVKNEYYWRSMLALGITSAGVFYAMMPREKMQLSKNNVIVITGCDSGLGHAMVRHFSSLPITIVATFLNLQSEGALLIKSIFEQNRKAVCHLTEMDIVNSGDIEDLVKFVAELLRKNPEYKLSALVNNSGVMAFGEFEWQTEAIMQHQISVNFLGTVMLTHRMLPILRKDKGRIVTVTSHCGIETLPGLSIYGATKKALAGWMDAIRVELRPYGVKAVTFIPGSFVMASNISARQNMLANEMRCAMTAEQMEFYGEYFDRYNNYLSILSGDKPACSLNDRNIISTCERALFDRNPSAVYKCEPPRYTMYYTIFQWAPYWLRDYLVVKFMNTPTYNSKNYGLENNGKYNVVV